MRIPARWAPVVRRTGQIIGWLGMASIGAAFLAGVGAGAWWMLQP